MYVSLGETAATAESGGIAAVAAQIQCAAEGGTWTGTTCKPKTSYVPPPSGGGGGGGTTAAASSTSQFGTTKASLTVGGVLVVGLLVAGAAYMYGQNRR